MERHVYRLQRLIFISGRTRTLLIAQKFLLTSIASQLFVSRFILNSKIPLIAKLNAHQKFIFATSFGTDNLRVSTEFLKYTLGSYLKQHLMCLILEPYWVVKFKTFQILSGRHKSFRSYCALKNLLSSPVYVLRVDLRQGLQGIKPTKLLSFLSPFCSEIFTTSLRVFSDSSNNAFLPNYNSSVYSLLTDIVVYYTIQHVLTLPTQLFFPIKSISSNGVVLFSCRKWATIQNLEVNLKAWVSNVLRVGWCKKIIFSYHHTTKSFFNLGFEFSGFFIERFYRKKIRLRCSKLAVGTVSGVLTKIKYILRCFSSVQLVVFQIRRILVELISYYSWYSLKRPFYSKLFFQIRHKLVC